MAVLRDWCPDIHAAGYFDAYWQNECNDALIFVIFVGYKRWSFLCNNVKIASVYMISILVMQTIYKKRKGKIQKIISV